MSLLGNQFSPRSSHSHFVLAITLTLAFNGSPTHADQDSSVTNEDRWFTCKVEPVCVEYLIDDPTDRANFTRQCANHVDGRACQEGRSCTHRALGRVSVTYGGEISDTEFRKSCIDSGGTPSW